MQTLRFLLLVLRRVLPVAIGTIGVLILPFHHRLVVVVSSLPLSQQQQQRPLVSHRTSPLAQSLSSSRCRRSSSSTMCFTKNFKLNTEEEKRTADNNSNNYDANTDPASATIPASDSTSTTTWTRQTWNPFRLAVLRLGMTEPSMTSPLNYGKYNDGEQFVCAYCHNVLFDANAKYNSGTGWPSFWRTVNDNAIHYRREYNGSLECQCQRCSSHLGHVFLDGPSPTSVDSNVLAQSPASDPRRNDRRYLPRYCMNGAALIYKKNTQQEEE